MAHEIIEKHLEVKAYTHRGIKKHVDTKMKAKLAADKRMKQMVVGALLEKK